MIDKQITLRLTADDLSAMDQLANIVAGPRGSRFVGPTAVIRFAMQAAIEAAQRRDTASPTGATAAP